MNLFPSRPGADELAELGFRGWPLAEDAWWRPDASLRIGRYAPIERLACSPPEVCYRATSMAIGGFQRWVFVRVLPGAMTDLRADAIRELAQLQHAGIAQVYDVGMQDDRLFWVAQYVDGSSAADLARDIARGAPPLAWELAIVWLSAARVALLAMHRIGVASAVTPARLRVTRDGMALLCPALPGDEVLRAGLAGERHEAGFWDLVDALVPLAAPGDERVAALVATRWPDSLRVLCDLVLESRSDLARPLVEAVHAIAEAPTGVAAGLTDAQYRAARGTLTEAHRRDFLARVIRCSADYQGRHQRLGATAVSGPGI